MKQDIDAAQQNVANARTKTPKKAHWLPHGHGTFYYRDTDQRWVGTVEAGWTVRGTRRRITVTDRDEDRAWAKFQAKRKTILIEGIPAEGTGGTMTVRVWATGWIERRQADVKPKTYATEKSVTTKWIIPTLGNRHLDALGPEDMRKLVQTILAVGRTQTTARYAQRVFQQMLHDAVRDGHKVPDPALQAKKPAASVNDRKAIPLADLQAIMRETRRFPHWTRWAVAALLGMRQGECLGLTWDSVDLNAGTLAVDWQLQEVNATRKQIPAQYEAQHLTGSFYLLRPKSRSSRRTIPMPTQLAEAMREWRQVAPHSKYGLVWPGPDGGIRSATMDRKEWRQLLTAAKVPAEGRPYAVHELRHSTVSLLMAAKVPVTTIEAIAGHSKLVESYAHSDDGQKSLAVEALQKMLAP